MARGTTLLNIRSFLKAEIGDFAGTNTTRDSELNARLSNEQKRLGAEFNWSFLERRWDVAVTARQQYVTLPTVTAGDPETETVAINTSREVRVDVLYTQKYFMVEYGVEEAQYNLYNYPIDGNTSDPIRRWRLATNINESSNANQFEVWPVPSTAQTLRFVGQRVIQTLSSDTDTADLDDMLLVYFVAANILMREKQLDAQLMLQKAQRLFQLLKQQDKQIDKKRCLGGTEENERRKDIKLVAIAGAH
jgi:hypothetical protein